MRGEDVGDDIESGGFHWLSEFRLLRAYDCDAVIETAKVLGKERRRDGFGLRSQSCSNSFRISSFCLALSEEVITFLYTFQPFAKDSIRGILYHFPL